MRQQLLAPVELKPVGFTPGTNDDGVYSGPTGWGTPDGIKDF
jgi:hypothetical protein